MSVFVDEFMIWLPSKIPCFRKGSCHMTADNEDELHAMAKKIGLRRAWFQPHPIHRHYDLTESKRNLALRAGAVFVPALEQARRRKRGGTQGALFAPKKEGDAT